MNLSENLKIRDFREEDYKEVAEIQNLVFPEMPLTADEFREWDKKREKKCKHRRWMVSLGGQVVGTGLYTQYSFYYHPKKFNIWIIVKPEFQRKGIGTILYDHIIEQLERYDPILIRCEVREDMPIGLKFMETRGFKEFQRRSNSELDMATVDLSDYTSKMAAADLDGIEIKTLKELEGDPERNRKMYQLNREIIPDLPDDEELTQINFETYVRFCLESSHTIPEAHFVAVDGDEYVGLSTLEKSATDKNLFTGFTGVRREYRGRGIATHLKIQAIRYAKKNKAPLIKTDNMAGNAPMLSLNRKLGFKKQKDWIRFHKEIRQEVE